MSTNLKEEVEEAAAISGATFTAFATQALVERARQVKREYTTTILNDEERDAFLELLASPPQPSPELRQLLRTEVEL